MMTILDHNRSEWRRMAADAALTGRTFWQERYTRMAEYDALPNATFDDVAGYYRAWLVFGWPEVDRLTDIEMTDLIARLA